MSDSYNYAQPAPALGGAMQAFMAEALRIRTLLRQGGFSEIETGRLTDTYLRNWVAVVTEGQSGSTGV